LSNDSVNPAESSTGAANDVIAAMINWTLPMFQSACHRLDYHHHISLSLYYHKPDSRETVQLAIAHNSAEIDTTRIENTECLAATKQILESVTCFNWRRGGATESDSFSSLFLSVFLFLFVVFCIQHYQWILPNESYQWI
jgi:hypothetical protein